MSVCGSRSTAGMLPSFPVAEEVVFSSGTKVGTCRAFSTGNARQEPAAGFSVPGRPGHRIECRTRPRERRNRPLPRHSRQILRTNSGTCSGNSSWPDKSGPTELHQKVFSHGTPRSASPCPPADDHRSPTRVHAPLSRPSAAEKTYLLKSAKNLLKFADSRNEPGTGRQSTNFPDSGKKTVSAHQSPQIDDDLPKPCGQQLRARTLSNSLERLNRTPTTPVQPWHDPQRPGRPGSPPAMAHRQRSAYEVREQGKEHRFGPCADRLLECRLFLLR